MQRKGQDRTSPKGATNRVQAAVALPTATALARPVPFLTRANKNLTNVN